MVCARLPSWSLPNYGINLGNIEMLFYTDRVGNEATTQAKKPKPCLPFFEYPGIIL